MRYLKLVDAVIQLKDIALIVETEIGTEAISNEIRQIADRLHVYSIDDDKANSIAHEIIKQVKE